MSGNTLSFTIEIESKLEGAKLAKAEIEKQIAAAKAAGTEYKHLESALRMVDSQIANLTKTMAADRAATAGLSKETADYVRNLREMGDQSEEAAGAHRGLHHEISALAGVIPGVAELAAFSISEVAGLAAVLGYVFSKEKEGIENLKATMASAYKQLDLSNIWRSNREQLQDLNLSEERHAELLARIAAQQDTVTEAMQRNLRVAAAQSAANQESDDARTKLEKATIEREQKFNPNEREKQLMEADNRAEERRVKRDHDARHMQEMAHQNAAQGEESSAENWGKKASQARAELAALTKSGGSQETIGQFAGAHLQDLGNINELLSSKTQRRAELQNTPWLLRSTAEQIELGTLRDEQIPDLQRRKTPSGRKPSHKTKPPGRENSTRCKPPRGGWTTIMSNKQGQPNAPASSAADWGKNGMSMRQRTGLIKTSSNRTKPRANRTGRKNSKPFTTGSSTPLKRWAVYFAAAACP